MRRVLLGFALLLIVGCVGQPTSKILSPCTVDGVAEPLLCGQLEVPEDRTVAGGRMIRLNVVVVPALRDSLPREAWFDIEGGPGDAATDMASVYVNELPMYRQERDVVLVDQRGTGGSASLYCPELDDPENPTQARFEAQAVATCRDRFQKAGVDLSRYSTADAVEDLEEVRKALGYEKVHTWAISYGTSVAQLYAKRYPQSLASATLWGALSPTFSRPLYYARDAQRAWDLLVQACETESRCGAAYPDLDAQLASVLSALERNPVTIELLQDPPHSALSVEVDRRTFAAVVRSGMFHTSRARQLPRMISAAAAGDYGPFAEFGFTDNRLRIRDVAESMLLSATCAEETLSADTSQVKELHQSTFMGRDRFDRQTAACSAWPTRPAEADFSEALVSDLPVVLITGEWDPVTPPEWSHEIARTLPNSSLLVIPEMGHLETGITGTECLHHLIVDFAGSGALRSPGTCLESLTAPPFVLPQ